MLRPLGITRRLPNSTAELRSAVRCILTCLQSLHGAGWAHLDLRRENVAFISPDERVVIGAGDSDWRSRLGARRHTPRRRRALILLV